MADQTPTPQAPTAPAQTPASAAPVAQAPAAPVYDSAKTYNVKLKRTVEWPAGSGFYYKPRDSHMMLGSVCKELSDAIVTANPVQ